MNWLPSHPTWRALLQAFVQESSPIYMVGGVVRDRMLGHRESSGESFADLDLVATHAAIPLARRVADRLGWSFYALDEGRDVARLIFTHNSGNPLVCDVARMRGDTIAADLLARDFTINAMAVEFSQQAAPQFIDICNGMQDLQQKLIRRVSLASLADDSVRMLRAVRLSLQLGFALEDETRKQIERLSSTIVIASPERLRDELWKCLAGDQPAAAIQEMHKLGLLRHMLPEVAAMLEVEQSAPHALDVYQHTLWVVEFAHQLRQWLKGKQSTNNNQQSTANKQQSTIDAALSMLKPYLFHLRDHFLKPMVAQRLRVDWLVWLALFHDIGKAVTRTAEIQADGTTRYRFFEHDLRGAEMAVRRLERLHFSRAEIDLADVAVKAHMRPHFLHDSFSNATSEQSIQSLQSISRRARYRFFRDLGGRQQLGEPTGIDVLLLALADRLALDAQVPLAVGAVSIPHVRDSIETVRYGNRTDDQEPLSADWRAYLAHLEELLHFAYDDAQAAFARQQPLVDGYLLMNRFALSPGPHLGALLEKVQEAQATGEVNTTDAALAFVEELLKS